MSLAAANELTSRAKEIQQIEQEIRNLEISPLFHPAVTFYNLDYKNQLEEDINVLKQFV